MGWRISKSSKWMCGSSIISKGTSAKPSPWIPILESAVISCNRVHHTQGSPNSVQILMKPVLLSTVRWEITSRPQDRQKNTKIFVDLFKRTTEVSISGSWQLQLYKYPDMDVSMRWFISWESIIRPQIVYKSLEAAGDWFDWLHSDSYEKRWAQYNKNEKIPSTFMQETIYLVQCLCF